MDLWESRTEISFDAAAKADELLLEQNLESWSVYEDVITKRAWIQGMFPTMEEAKAQGRRLRPLLDLAGVGTIGDTELKEIEDREWKDSYKAHFKAWQFGRLHWVPEWERASTTLPPGDVALWLDPGLAFGTGNHETTRLCCERLVKLAAEVGDLRSWRVIDAGCGSGILALSAVLLGAGKVEAFDNDPEAVRISGENAAMNGLLGRLYFFEGDLASGLKGRTADLVLANILADVLMAYHRNLLGAVAPGGTLVLSGILAQERDQVMSCYSAQAPGWKLDSRIMGEWADVVLTRPV